MAAYRFLVGDLVPSSGNGLRDEVPFSTVKYGHVLNRPGGLEATISLRHPKATRDNLDPGRTAVHVERDGVITWSGIIWAVGGDIERDNLKVSAEGWWSYFRRRLIRSGTGGPSPSTASSRVYLNQDQLFIARDLVNYAQAQPGGNIGVVVGSELTTDNGGVQRHRDRTYEHYERKNLAEAVEQLAAVRDGFDFAVDVAYEAGVITKRLRLGYPRRGRITDMVWELGTNLEGFSQDVDAGRQANQVDAFGAGEGDSMLIATAADTSQIGAYPLLEGVVTFKDTDTVAMLQAQAAMALTNLARPVAQVPTLLARQGNPDTGLGSFITGDSVRVRASTGWVDVDERMRIMEWSASVDQDGREQVSVAFAQEEATVG